MIRISSPFAIFNKPHDSPTSFSFSVPFSLNKNVGGSRNHQKLGSSKSSRNDAVFDEAAFEAHPRRQSSRIHGRGFQEGDRNGPQSLEMGYPKEGLGFHGDPQNCPKSSPRSPPYPQFCWRCSCCSESEFLLLPVRLVAQNFIFCLKWKMLFSHPVHQISTLCSNMVHCC